MENLKGLTLALCASLMLTAVGVGLFWAGSRAQRDHDRECLRTDATWSDVMGCMNGERAP